MKPYAKYSFRRQYKFVKYFTEHILDDHTGVDIPNFPTEWISLHRTCSYSGKSHPAFKEMQEAYQFTNAVSLEGIAFIGLNEIPELQGFHYGYFGNDAVLLRFEIHKHNNNIPIKKVTLYFFEGMKEKLSTFYDLCISGQLEIDLECECIPDIKIPEPRYLFPSLWGNKLHCPPPCGGKIKCE